MPLVYRVFILSTVLNSTLLVCRIYIYIHIQHAYTLYSVFILILYTGRAKVHNNFVCFSARRSSIEFVCVLKTLFLVFTRRRRSQTKNNNMVSI